MAVQNTHSILSSCDVRLTLSKMTLFLSFFVIPAIFNVEADAETKSRCFHVMGGGGWGGSRSWEEGVEEEGVDMFLNMREVGAISLQFPGDTKTKADWGAYSSRASPTSGGRKVNPSSLSIPMCDKCFSRTMDRRAAESLPRGRRVIGSVHLKPTRSLTAVIVLPGHIIGGDGVVALLSAVGSSEMVDMVGEDELAVGENIAGPAYRVTSLLCVIAVKFPPSMIPSTEYD